MAGATFTVSDPGCFTPTDPGCFTAPGPTFVVTGSTATPNLVIATNEWWTTNVTSTASTTVWTRMVYDAFTTNATVTWASAPAGAVRVPGGVVQLQPVHYRSQTPEEIARAERAYAEERARIAAEAARQRRRSLFTRRRARRDQRSRAESLMRLALTPEQWSQWRIRGCVDVVGSLGGRYQIGPGPHGQMIVDLASKRTICYQPVGGYCVEDSVLALVLDIQSNEQNIRTKGNRATTPLVAAAFDKVLRGRWFKDIDVRREDVA